ncbi:MAG: hypothetical protein P4L65_07050 [Legionella sp.]|nr:hypothetical protein [Legionella sp.]
MKTLFRILLVSFVLSVNLWAAESVSPWYTLGVDKKVTINAALFLASTCEHCHKADAFFNKIAAADPQLKIQRNIINEDKKALFRFNQLLSEQHADDFAVPSIYFCNSRWVGYASDETTGKDLLHAINYCKQQIEKDGTLSQSTVDTLKHWASANRFDVGLVGNPGAFAYIMTIALTDSVSPCAFFCFATLLAFLFIEEKRKNQTTAGLLFIFAVVLAHYYQQAFTSSFYGLLPWLRIPAALLGMVTLYFVSQRYQKKQYNKNLYFTLAFLLGLMIMIYQQTCVMNWSYIFEQWLGNQNLTTMQSVWYQLVYQVMYLLPLLITLIVYLSMLKMKRIAAMRSRLMVIGYLFIAAIALALIIYPAVLSFLGISLIALLILIVTGYFLNLT